MLPTHVPSDPLRKLWQVLLGLALLCILLSQVAPHWSHESVLTPATAELGDLHGVKWDGKTQTLRCGRDDPHFEIQLPWLARPATQITLNIEPIWGNVGLFQFYYIPVDAVEPFFTQKWHSDVDAAIYGGIYPLKGEFSEPADRIRVDPPDAAEFVVKSVVVLSWPGRH